MSDCNVCDTVKNSNSMNKMSLIDHIKQIIEISKREGLSDDFFSEAESNLKFVCRKTKLNKIEVVFFSHFLDSAAKALTIFDIGQQIKLDSLETMKYLDVIENLFNKKYIQEDRWGMREGKQKHYTVPLYIQKMIAKGKYTKYKKSNLNIDEVFNSVQILYDKRQDDEIDYYEYEREVIDIIERNKNLPFFNMIDKWNLTKENKVLFISLCYMYLDSENNYFSINNIESLYKNTHGMNTRRILSCFKTGIHVFFKQNILCPAEKSSFGDRECFSFTFETQKQIDLELDIQSNNLDNRKGLLKHEDLKQKTMFYNEKNREKIEDLFSLLKEENFINIKKRLSDNGMRTGFACLFSGLPGTGKTEYVYQIAKQTERDIMLVDISEIKSKWFSESEKNIKAVFTRYRKLLEHNEKAPILFFNEADAIFSKRRQLEDARGGPGQTENAIQNIILQEMENLEGILICTTNLTKNFDKAFERRFLYKIEFDKPSSDIRKKIWKSIIPELAEEHAEELSTSFDFSGGQIENIARKRISEIVLKGENPSLEKLMGFCEDELLEKDTSKVIGF